MTEIRIVDVTDAEAFGRLPPCADPAFDHRTCDYWEDADRGTKASRPELAEAAVAPPSRAPAGDPFEAGRGASPANPFAPAGTGGYNPFAPDPGSDAMADNPFAPVRADRPRVDPGAPRKLALLGRGLAVFGSYAKVALVDDVSVAYAQFGPLSAYPRASRLRALYPQLPDAPLPAVITCIATTAEARGAGYARGLVSAVCADLAGRGFAAVEAYPEIGAPTDATSAASPAVWVAGGFALVVDDERFPVVRRELA